MNQRTSYHHAPGCTEPLDGSVRLTTQDDTARLPFSRSCTESRVILPPVRSRQFHSSCHAGRFNVQAVDDPTATWHPGPSDPRPDSLHNLVLYSFRCQLHGHSLDLPITNCTACLTSSTHVRLFLLVPQLQQDSDPTETVTCQPCQRTCTFSFRHMHGPICIHKLYFFSSYWMQCPCSYSALTSPLAHWSPTPLSWWTLQDRFLPQSKKYFLAVRTVKRSGINHLTK